MITLIKIPVQWRVGPDADDRTGNTKEFKLGLGPCGKTVHSLGICFGTRDFVRITQRCSDGTSMDFYFKTVDITGRILVYNH